jgi:cell wall-associated NlpC family hydrolase
VSWWRGLLVATTAGLACASALAGTVALAGATDSTPTTLPGPAPNQSQINASQSQVSQIESTLSQEQQESGVLDNRYDNAVQSLQNAQNSLRITDANLNKTRSLIRADRKRLGNDAVLAYIYGAPESKFASFFSSSATLSDARNQYTTQIVGDLDRAKESLQTTQSRLQVEEAQQQSEAAKAQAQAAQAKSLAQANQQEAAATQSTLNSVQGQLVQEVAQAAIEEAQQEAAAAAQAATAAAAQRAAAAAAAAAAVAQSVGGSASGAAATTAANQGSGVTVSGTATGDSAQMAAVQAAESQLGVPYVWGGEAPGVGFDCSGLTQWSWSQAGVSIPRTTETQWAELTHVSLDALEPGDLLYYYDLDGDSQVDHVVMYTGSGPYGSDTVIQAPFTGSSVSYAPLFTSGLIGAARP